MSTHAWFSLTSWSCDSIRSCWLMLPFWNFPSLSFHLTSALCPQGTSFPVLFSLDCHHNSSWSFQKKPKKLFTFQGVRASDPCYFCSRKGKWAFLFLLPPETQSCVGNGDHKGARALAICSAVQEDSHSSQTFDFIFPTSWEARLRAQTCVLQTWT